VGGEKSSGVAMGKFAMMIGLLFLVGFAARIATASDYAAIEQTKVGGITWTASNLQTLESFGYSDVAEFLGVLGAEWEDGENIATADRPIGSRENYHMYGIILRFHQISDRCSLHRH
jgi:hypothetical protein